MIKCARIFGVVFSWFVAAMLVAFAASTANANPLRTENARVSLVSEVSEIAPGEPFWVALRIEAREGWHTYWRYAGDSGLPTTIDWTLPDGFIAGDIVWPAPERINVGPLVNFGYHGDTFHLVKMTVPEGLKPGHSATFSANANWLICEEICIPENATLTLTLPIAAGPPAANPPMAAAFNKVREILPRPSPWAVTFATSENAFHIFVPLTAEEQSIIRSATFFPIDDGVITNAAPQKLEHRDDGLLLTMARGYQSNLPDRLGGLLKFASAPGEMPDESFTFTATRGAISEATPGATTIGAAGGGWKTLLQAAVFAFIGGLILNLMPCVLPVLSFKALHLARQTEVAPAAARLEGWVYTAGILTSFAGIFAAMLTLRAGGAQIGWGFQLQSPLVVTLLAYVLFLVGLYLSGIITLGNRFAGVGESLAARPGHTGTYFTGVLATIVATPCTAPFMAPAIGIAFTQPAPVAAAVFAALGFGLAFPFLVISHVPAMRRWLPKPGPWMGRLQQFLAFPMYGAAAWLLWVLNQQAGSTGLAIALSGIVLIAFAAWLYKLTRNMSVRPARTGAAASTLIILAAIGGAAFVVRSDGEASSTEKYIGDIASEAYSAARLATLRENGRPVFINFTAAWCITCKVNERMAFNDATVVEQFRTLDIAYLLADWTNRDPAITEALESFGRSGVPLYVLYPPDDGAPTILPQLLTPGILSRALAAAG